MELNELPDELLLRIFSYLPLCSLSDVSYLTLTCSKWRRILWSKHFLQHISSFKYQSRFLIYHYSLNKNSNQNSLHQFLEYDSNSTTPYLNVNGELSSLKQDITNCPLINMSISMWCRTLSHMGVKYSNTILLLWHFHLGYIGFYRYCEDLGYALVKCTYTQGHELSSTIRLELGEWYHVGIVIEEKSLQLYINGNRIGTWPLQEKINTQNLSTAPHSCIWLASHCGANTWHGSLYDICVWNRCLKSYELKEMARIRTTVEKMNFIPHLQF